ncbi:MAG: uL30 family ribosomal protein [Nanoarchaeota archaeon]
MPKLAVIRIHGQTGLRHQVKDTLQMLKLFKKYTCRIIEDNPQMRGMVFRVKDQVTWGELNAEMEAELMKKAGDNKVVHLHPPIGGFERKGTKKPFNLGGALGNRKEKINDLLKRMI